MAENQTIIIKKIKKGGHGHHGGAWKVAYADFVTAMMAFFLLLWLLTATPVEQLEGLADYFSPTMGLQGKMGIGFSGGRAPDSDGWSTGDWASMGLIFGSAPSGPIMKFPDKDNKTDEDNERVNFEKIKDTITESVEESEVMSKYKDSVLIEQTPEGLNIQITDQNKRPMFEEGTAILMPHTKKILAKIASIVSHIPNYIHISGHTNGTFKVIDQSYTAWELSADRANAARRYMAEVGVGDSQILRIIAKGDNDPLNRGQESAPENSRISITLLRKSVVALHRMAAPDEIILGPIEHGMKSFVKVKNRKDSEEEVREKKHEESKKKTAPAAVPAEH